MTQSPVHQSDRQYYDAEMAAGLDRFRQARRETCPWCGSGSLAVEIRSRELFQRKPGVFTLERCRTCGHVFQNPRLTLDGLTYYYRDFYDGRGRDHADTMASYGGAANTARAEMVRPHFGPDGPKSWLDVGTGYAYFAKHAAEVLPNTVFDGLDQNDGVAEAVDRGWLREAYRENFPEIAGELTGRYDVISMHHYLEHTLDPRAELAAAATALEPGSYLLIEMPDIESRLRHVFRSWWVPYFQPQHLHFIPVGNLCQALTEQGFTPVEIHQGEAHQPVEVLMALVFALSKLAPDPDQPWRRPDPPRWRRTVNTVAWTKAFPQLLKAAVKADQLLTPIVRRTGDGNAYRVLARREARR